MMAGILQFFELKMIYEDKSKLEHYHRNLGLNLSQDQRLAVKIREQLFHKSQ